MTSSHSTTLIKGELHVHSKGKGRLLLLTEDSIASLLAAGVKRVVVTNHGNTYHLAFQKSKTLGYYLMLNADIMKHHVENGGSYAGTMTVAIAADHSELQFKTSEVLEELLMQDEEANQLFQQLSSGKKRSLIHWIESAKSMDVRIKRALQTAEKLKEGSSNP